MTSDERDELLKHISKELIKTKALLDTLLQLWIKERLNSKDSLYKIEKIDLLKEINSMVEQNVRENLVETALENQSIQDFILKGDKSLYKHEVFDKIDD